MAGKVDELRDMTLEEKYHELTRYGIRKEDMEIKDKDGGFVRISVFDFNGTKWFMHLRNGDIIKIDEV